LRIFARLTVIWGNDCSTALVRRRVFTQPRPISDMGQAAHYNRARGGVLT
jgi:hypothetical protein